jgi:hypothetical protein
MRKRSELTGAPEVYSNACIAGLETYSPFRVAFLGGAENEPVFPVLPSSMLMRTRELSRRLGSLSV